MKKIIVLCSLIALSGCGGFNDMDAARNAQSGIGNTVTPPSNPDTPIKTNWRYSSFETGGRVYELKANNFALNSFRDPKFDIQNTPWVEIEKLLSSSGATTSTLTIFVNSTVSCSPSCDVRMNFDGQIATYRMQNSIEGVIRPIDTATNTTLIRKFTSSNWATVSLPIIGLSKPFDARFDVRGYDAKKMSF